MPQAESGTEVLHVNVALRDVDTRLEDAHSFQVVVVLLLYGQAVLSAHASEDVRLGLVNILCKQHQLFIVSYQSCMQISPVDISQNSYGCTRTSRHLLSRADSWVVHHSLQVRRPPSAVPGIELSRARHSSQTELALNYQYTQVSKPTSACT